MAARDPTAAQIRDIRVMAARGKDFAYIRDVFGWKDERLKQACINHGIAVQGLTLSPRRGISTAPYMSTQVGHPGRKKEPRSETIAAVTTTALKAVLDREAAKRDTTKGGILHDLLVVIEARNLWADLLDSNSVPVASASHRNENNERQE